MKAILEFNLPDEELDFKQVNKAKDALSVLWDFKAWLRNQLKWNAEKLDVKTLERCQNEFTASLDDNNVNLDELWI